PSPRDFVELFVAAAALASVALLFSPMSNLLHWSPRPAAAIAWIAVVAFFVPALSEEGVFRGLLIPDATEAPRAALPILISTALFTLWHVLEALWLPNARLIFLRADFLCLAALLGLACAILRRRSGSLWTPVLLHWAAAVTWIGFLGGPSF